MGEVAVDDISRRNDGVGGEIAEAYAYLCQDADLTKKGKSWLSSRHVYMRRAFAHPNIAIFYNHNPEKDTMKLHKGYNAHKRWKR